MLYSRTKEELEQLIKESFSKSEVARKLGLNGTGGSSYRTVNSLIQIHEIDISHFKGQSHMKGKTHNRSKKISLDDILVENSTYLNTHRLKGRLVKAGLLSYECSICELTEWNGRLISLHLDHINGICNDNRIENLRILCPNCHSQCPSHGRGGDYLGRSKLKESAILKAIKHCKNCSKRITKVSERCKSCAAKMQKEKIVWPTFEELSNLVKKNGYSKTGRILGVSDNAVRKRLKRNGSSGGTRTRNP